VCVSVYAADFPIFVHFFFSWPLFDGEHEAYRSRIWILCSTLVSVAHVPGRQVSSFVVVICGEEKKKKLKCYGSSRAPCYLLCSRLQYFGMQLHGSRAHLHTYWISDTVYICKRDTAPCARFCAAATAQSCVCEYFLCCACMRICAFRMCMCVYVCVYVTQFHPYTNITLHRAQARWPTEISAELSRDWICLRSKVHLRLVLAG
jgi:hypothetical protein